MAATSSSSRVSREWGAEGIRQLAGKGPTDACLGLLGGLGGLGYYIACVFLVFIVALTFE